MAKLCVCAVCRVRRKECVCVIKANNNNYRDAEKVAREGSIGMLATKKMPKRKASSALQFKTAFRTWMRESLVAKVCLLSACLA